MILDEHNLPNAIELQGCNCTDVSVRHHFLFGSCDEHAQEK